MGKKTLAEELAELANPAPTKEYDPEVDVFGAGPTLEESDDELQAGLPKSKGKERRRLQGDIIMEDKDYAGRKSSRAALFENVTVNPVFSPEEGTSDDNDDSGSESDEDEDDEEDLNNGMKTNKFRPHSGSSSSEEANEDDDGSSSSGDDDDQAYKQTSDHDEHAAGDDDEMTALEREYAAMQAAEIEAAAGLQERAIKERRKAKAVAAQQTIWQRGLEARILLQRVLHGANRLPQGETHAVACEEDDEIKAGFRGLASDTAGLLKDLMSLLDTLEEQHPAVQQAAEAAGVMSKKRARDDDADEDEQNKEQRVASTNLSDDLWRDLDERYNYFVPFRDASIDRWHRKTVLTTGGGGGRSGLRALNQSVSAQVSMLMRDAERVVRRTQLPKRQRKLLCAIEEEHQQASARFDQEGDRNPAASEAADALDEERDPETYDDTEFYQTLLKEFLDGSNEAGAGNWYSGPKQRKAVDRRASKGRKLRYHIHEKLVNFVTPTELEAPQYASNIFANLFGGGTSNTQRRR